MPKVCLLCRCHRSSLSFFELPETKNEMKTMHCTQLNLSWPSSDFALVSIDDWLNQHNFTLHCKMLGFARSVYWIKSIQCKKSLQFLLVTQILKKLLTCFLRWKICYRGILTYGNQNTMVISQITKKMVYQRS